MKILNTEVKGSRYLLGTFQMTADTVIVTDPCYNLGTWCQAQIENVQQGTWKGHVYRKIDSFDLKCREKRIADLQENIVKTKARASSLGAATLSFFLEDFEKMLKEAYEADCSRVSVLIAHHELVDPFNSFDNEWKAVEADIGVDSGQMSISSIDNWKDQEKCLDYEGPETPNEEYPEVPHRGSTGPYWKICELTGSKFGGGVIDNRAVVSQSGWGDGSYVAFTLNHNDKVVGIAVVFIPDWNEEE